MHDFSIIFQTILLNITFLDNSVLPFFWKTGLDIVRKNFDSSDLENSDSLRTVMPNQGAMVQ